MIIIVCSNLDENAKLLKAKWANNNAVLLSVNDLTSPGWQISASNFNESIFVAEEQVWPVSAVKGIVNLLPQVAPYELFKIVEDDRKYVASEMNAFLFYFFSKMKCPFLNEPSMFNLSGPFIKQEEWIMQCIMAKLPVHKKLENVNGLHKPLEPNTDISICYSRGKVSSKQNIGYENEIRKLAANTGLSHFVAYFKQEQGQYFFQTISTYPNVDDDKELDEIMKHFQN